MVFLHGYLFAYKNTQIKGNPGCKSRPSDIHTSSSPFCQMSVKGLHPCDLVEICNKDWYASQLSQQLLQSEGNSGLDPWIFIYVSFSSARPTETLLHWAFMSLMCGAWVQG